MIKRHTTIEIDKTTGKKKKKHGQTIIMKR
jgi:hypothetical protein